VAALGLVAVLLMCCATWLATDWLRSRVDGRSALVAARAGSLRQAERALAFFAAAHGRLPCAAATLWGPENCGSDGPGWLPSATLGWTDRAAASDDVPVRYEPRGPHEDAAGSAFPGPAGDPASPRAHPPDGYDFCARLRDTPVSVGDANPWTFLRGAAAPGGPATGTPAARP
jgi:hypothetical protein